jgi:Cu(I)/Ag(I) efflux system membrane fusion protein/cobalt-zinc-cadmium efflux system membrane fusion protein
MKSTIKVLSALVVGFLLGIWLGGGEEPVPMAETASYNCPMHPMVISDRPGTCPVCGMDLVKVRQPASETSSGDRKILFWRAPMDPNFTSEKPGKSPMGMDLIPVYADGAATEGVVRIDPVTIQNIGVKTALVERKPVTRMVRTVGRVDTDETGLSDVTTKVSGWVEYLFADYTGQEVAAGQKLLNLYSPELVAAQEEYLSALTFSRRLATTRSDEGQRGAFELLDASRQRLLYLDVQQESIDRLATTMEASRVTTIRAPHAGVVVHKGVVDGAHIKAGQHLYRIADLSRVWIQVDVYESELPWVKVGQTAEMEFASRPGEVMAGIVTYIDPVVEPKSRTVKVRIDVANPEGYLKPEMYANVRIMASLNRNSLMVPSQAIIRSGSRSIAVVALGEGAFRPQEVVLGIESGGELEVMEGLKEGDRIVTSSQFLIDSESNLKAAMSAMVSKGTPESSTGEAGPEMDSAASAGGHTH